MLKAALWVIGIFTQNWKRAKLEKFRTIIFIPGKVYAAKLSLFLELKNALLLGSSTALAILVVNKTTRILIEPTFNVLQKRKKNLFLLIEIKIYDLLRLQVGLPSGYIGYLIKVLYFL